MSVLRFTTIFCQQEVAGYKNICASYCVCMYIFIVCVCIIQILLPVYCYKFFLFNQEKFPIIVPQLLLQEGEVWWLSATLICLLDLWHQKQPKVFSTYDINHIANCKPQQCGNNKLPSWHSDKMKCYSHSCILQYNIQYTVYMICAMGCVTGSAR